jgi:hypothetical protein
MSLAPSVSLGIITTALLGEVFIFYESKREELQELLALFNKQRSDNEALRTTNIFSQEVRYSLRPLEPGAWFNAAADWSCKPNRGLNRNTTLCPRRSWTSKRSSTTPLAR